MSSGPLSDADLASITKVDFSDKTEEEILEILARHLSHLSEEVRQEIAKKILASQKQKD